MNKFQPTLLLSTIIVACTIFIAGFVERTNSLQLLGIFAFAFGAYSWLTFSKDVSDKLLYRLILIGILARVILVFTIPNLSDDFFRFVWDGRLLHLGINPFLELPSYYIENQLYPDILTEDIYNQLNSQQYYTVYPPALQGVFWLATLIFPNSIQGSVIIMKSVLLLCEMGSIYLIIQLLQHFKLPKKNVLLYALNPVVMLEIVGSIHFEGMMIFFALLSVWLLVKGKWLWSALAISVAIGAKLLPLMFLPFLIKRLRWQSIKYYMVVGLGVLLLFSPLLNATFIEHISTSINLYFKNFEYNGSIYYILRWIGYQQVGYNWIALISPYLSVTIFIFIMTAALLVKERKFNFLPQNMLFALTVFYLLATTIHPWYITSMVAFGALTRFRYPMIWSGLIFFTYINYGYEPFQENLIVVAVEYLILFGWIGWELYTQSSLFLNLKKKIFVKNKKERHSNG